MESMDYEHGSTGVERLAAVPVADRPKVVRMVPQAPMTPPPDQPEAIRETVIIQRQEVSDVLLAAFSAMGFAVSARFLVFLSLFGAFVLAVMAMLSQSMMAVVVLSLFCILTVLPLVAVELFSKRGAN